VPSTAGMIPPVAFVFNREEVIDEIARLVVVAAVPVALRKVKFCKVEEPVERRLPTVAKPLPMNVVTPEIAPFVTSHVSESMSMRSPLSPMVRVAVVVHVPSTLLEDSVPPLTVSASATSSSTHSNPMVPPSVRAVESTLPALEIVSMSLIYASDSEEDAVTSPPIACSGPVSEPIARVAVVADSVSMPVKRDVDDACSPDWNQIGVFVAFTVAP